MNWHTAKAILLAILVAGCTSLPKKAIVEPEHVRRAFDANLPIERESRNLPAPGKPWFEVRKGHSKVLLVAGHATHPMRDGKLRFSDGGTGGFAISLAELTDSTLLYTSKASPSDPNYYDDNEFKRELARLLESERPVLVLDIHGSHWHRPYYVDFGTMGMKSLKGKNHYLKELIEYFRGEGIDNLSLDYFSAAKNQTVTKFVSARGIPCLQLEINSNYLPRAGDLDGERPQRVAQALQALTRFIDGVSGFSREENTKPD